MSFLLTQASIQLIPKGWITVNAPLWMQLKI